MKTYLRHGIHNVVDVKEFLALEYLDFEGRYKEYVEKHDFWEICYVEQGEITLTIENKNFQLVDVTSIAAALGFSELKYFNVLFKNRVGMTPLEYRTKM